MKTETIVWLVFLLIGAAAAGWLGVLLVGMFWLAYVLGIARATIHAARRYDTQARKK